MLRISLNLLFIPLFFFACHSFSMEKEIVSTDHRGSNLTKTKVSSILEQPLVKVQRKGYNMYHNINLCFSYSEAGDLSELMSESVEEYAKNDYAHKEADLGELVYRTGMSEETFYFFGNRRSKLGIEYEDGEIASFINSRKYLLGGNLQSDDTRLKLKKSGEEVYALHYNKVLEGKELKKRSLPELETSETLRKIQETNKDCVDLNFASWTHAYSFMALYQQNKWCKESENYYSMVKSHNMITETFRTAAYRKNPEKVTTCTYRIKDSDSKELRNPFVDIPYLVLFSEFTLNDFPEPTDLSRRHHVLIKSLDKLHTSQELDMIIATANEEAELVKIKIYVNSYNWDGTCPRIRISEFWTKQMKQIESDYYFTYQQRD